MSLDVHLEDENGNDLYWRNITHNLNKMAGTAGIYECLWRLEEIGITTAHQLIEPISKGIAFLAMHRHICELDNPPNGWGDWEALYDFCCSYLKACTEHPLAIVRVSR
jgi:hypothetical protein